MNSSGRWGFRASAALGVLCAALLAANFLLPRLEDASNVPRPETQWSDPAPDVAAVAHHPVGERADARQSPAPQQARLANRKARSAGRVARTAESRPETASPRDPVQNPKSEISNSQAPVQSQESKASRLIRPLGIVEKADGRVQAVIENGGWVELVEEGQVLADNRRVMRVSAEGVELALPDDAPAVELARTLPTIPERAAETMRAPEPLRAAAPAAGTAAAFRPDVRPLAVAGTASSSAVATTAEHAGPRSGRGRLRPALQQPAVQQSAGTTGQKLTAKPDAPVPPAQPATTETVRVGPVQNPEIGSENIVQPIGLVEWSDGRAQAVLAEGDFVQLAGDEELLAEARRVLAAPPAAEAPDEGLTFQAAGLPSREQEEEMAALAPSGEEERPPPEVDQAMLAEAEAVARGQPQEVAARDSRPPPFRARDDGLWEAELPGLEETSSATTGDFEAAARASFEIMREPQRVLGRSASENPLGGRSVPEETSNGTGSWTAAALLTQADGTRTIRPLGIVEWPDGHRQGVITDGRWVLLVEEGQRLWDGSRVTRVTAEAVTLQPPAAAGAGKLPEAGGTAAVNQHLTDHRLPSGLHLFRAMQDNRTQSRE